MIAIPLVAYAAVVVFAFVVIVTLLAVVYKSGRKTEDDASDTGKKTDKRGTKDPAEDEDDAPRPRAGLKGSRGGRRGRGGSARGRGGMGRMARRPIQEEPSSSSGSDDDEKVDEAIFKELQKE